jgi:hypothetical protein
LSLVKKKRKPSSYDDYDDCCSFPPPSSFFWGGRPPILLSFCLLPMYICPYGEKYNCAHYSIRNRIQFAPPLPVCVCGYHSPCVYIRLSLFLYTCICLHQFLHIF